jgi:hypothetical protein
MQKWCAAQILLQHCNRKKQRKQNQETKHEVENELATTYHSGLEQDSDFKRLQINMSSGTPAKEHLGSRSGVLPSSS